MGFYVWEEDLNSPHMGLCAALPRYHYPRHCECCACDSLCGSLRESLCDSLRDRRYGTGDGKGWLYYHIIINSPQYHF